MRRATIEIEMTCGTTIEDAFSEAIRIASILGVWCKFNFNGVECMACSSSNVYKGVDNYRKELNSDNKCKIAFAN